MGRQGQTLYCLLGVELHVVEVRCLEVRIDVLRNGSLSIRKCVLGKHLGRLTNSSAIQRFFVHLMGSQLSMYDCLHSQIRGVANNILASLVSMTRNCHLIH